MHGTAERMAASVADFTLSTFGVGRDALRKGARVVVILGLLALLAYCLQTAWTVLAELERVKLSEVKRALDVVSVRDAVLCLVGFAIGRELLRAIARASRD